MAMVQQSSKVEYWQHNIPLICHRKHACPSHRAKAGWWDKAGSLEGNHGFSWVSPALGTKGEEHIGVRDDSTRSESVCQGNATYVSVVAMA